MARVLTFGRVRAEILLLAIGLASQLGPGLCAKCECSADACTKDTLVETDISTPCIVGADGVLDYHIYVRAGAPRRRPPARHVPCSSLAGARAADARQAAGVASQPRTMQAASQRQAGRGGRGGPGRTQPLSCARPSHFH